MGLTYSLCIYLFIRTWYDSILSWLWEEYMCYCWSHFLVGWLKMFLFSFWVRHCTFAKWIVARVAVGSCSYFTVPTFAWTALNYFSETENFILIIVSVPKPLAFNRVHLDCSNYFKNDKMVRQRKSGFQSLKEKKPHMAYHIFRYGLSPATPYSFYWRSFFQYNTTVLLHCYPLFSFQLVWSNEAAFTNVL